MTISEIYNNRNY